jgi:Fe-S cluster assembly iron-binding protein IscA
LALDEPKADEQPVNINSVAVLVDAAVKPLIATQVLDYVTANGGQGFTLAPEGGQGCC